MSLQGSVINAPKAGQQPGYPVVWLALRAFYFGLFSGFASGFSGAGIAHYAVICSLIL